MHMILHGALVNQACAQKDELSHHRHLWSSQKTAEQAWNQIIIYLSIQKKAVPGSQATGPKQPNI